jgi:hypothetical protein
MGNGSDSVGRESVQGAEIFPVQDGGLRLNHVFCPGIGKEIDRRSSEQANNLATQDQQQKNPDKELHFTPPQISLDPSGSLSQGNPS